MIQFSDYSSEGREMLVLRRMEASGGLIPSSGMYEYRMMLDGLFAGYLTYDPKEGHLTAEINIDGERIIQIYKVSLDKVPNREFSTRVFVEVYVATENMMKYLNKIIETGNNSPTK